MTKLNLGCSDKIMHDVVNVDIAWGQGVDQVVDLSIHPWPWADGSVDEIYARHIIEHFQDPKAFLYECYRVLKPGGFLDIYLPHCSSITSVGMVEHYRTFCYNGLLPYLTGYKTVHHKLSWWYGDTNWKNLTPGIKYILIPLNFIMNTLINGCPALFENMWCYWVGGAREVQWKGIKNGL